jgi:hypothetical protein
LVAAQAKPGTARQVIRAKPRQGGCGAFQIPLCVGVGRQAYPYGMWLSTDFLGVNLADSKWYNYEITNMQDMHSKKTNSSHPLGKKGLARAYKNLKPIKVEPEDLKSIS